MTRPDAQTLDMLDAVTSELAALGADEEAIADELATGLEVEEGWRPHVARQMAEAYLAGAFDGPA